MFLVVSVAACHRSGPVTEWSGGRIAKIAKLRNFFLLKDFIIFGGLKSLVFCLLNRLVNIILAKNSDEVICWFVWIWVRNGYH